MQRPHRPDGPELVFVLRAGAAGRPRQPDDLNCSGPEHRPLTRPLHERNKNPLTNTSAGSSSN
jgi:hypothetical protein